MFTLYQPSALFGLPSSSPYCLKLEAFLRWQAIPFKLKPGLPYQGPFKKVPYADYKNERLGDSSVIIDRLISDHDITYPEHLNLSDGHVFQRMMEEHVYWAMVYFRWTDETIWPRLKKAFFDPVPGLIRPFIVSTSLKQAKRALYGQGIGRLPAAMVAERTDRDLSALAQHLEHQPFICGDTLTHYDIAVWAVLSQLMQCDLELPISALANSKEPLKAYLERVNAILKPLWESESEFDWFNAAAA